MKLRTQLIVAFLLLAVVPLTGISIYSYLTSLNAYRNVVEEEAGALAQDMRGRMETMRADVNRRVGLLGSFPFRQLMNLRLSNASPEQSRELIHQLMAEMGDAAAYIDSLEFVPGAHQGPLPPKRPDGSPPFHAEGAPDHRTPPASAERPKTPPNSNVAAALALESARRMILRLNPEANKLPETQLQQVRPKVSFEAGAEPDFKITVEEIEQSTEAVKAAIEAGKKAEEARRLAARNDVPSAELSAPSGEGHQWDVTAQSGDAGELRAHIRSPLMFRSVLSRSRIHPDDVPFVLDSEGKTHTADPADEAKLAGLDLGAFAAGIKTGLDAATKRDWVVVTRKDPRSDLSFGVARPIRNGLLQIRLTAARNLGYGLAMVGLALIGILPLSGRMTRNLAILTQGADQLARGNLQARVPVRTKDEFGKLAESFNRMAHDLDVHEKKLIEQEGLKKELEMCRRIQEELLPRGPLCSGLVNVQGVSIPAREVGGDFFNYFNLPDGRVALLVGDVSGKGIAAAMLMAHLQATLQARLPLGEDLSVLAGRLDVEISTGTPPELYLTLFMGILDQSDGSLRYVNAGHNPQFLLRENGGIERLESTGRPLGLLPGEPFAERAVPVLEGDSIFFYTDGLVEAENTEGEEFGMVRLQALLLELRSRPAGDLLSTVEQRLHEHRGGAEPSDDATLMVLKLGGIDGETAAVSAVPGS